MKKTLGQKEAREEILSRIARLRPDSQHQWGQMTVHEMICHLSDSYLGCMGQKYISPASGLFQRTVMKWGALWFPMPWPKGVPTRPEVQQGVGGTPPVDFDSDRARLVELVNSFGSPEFKDSEAEHPLFGRMSRQDWMRWGHLHPDHHLRQFGV